MPRSTRWNGYVLPTAKDGSRCGRSADLPLVAPGDALRASRAAFAAPGTWSCFEGGASFFLSQVWGDLNDKAERVARRVGVNPK